MGTLYIVATPIGNLEDVSYRLVRVLGQVNLLAAEDTRTARKLLSRYSLHPRIVSYNEHNHRTRTPQILEALGNGDVALVSEAGTPALSDPGRDLVRAAREHGHRISPIPGPSALTAALSASGMPIESGVLFLGFLPRRRQERAKLLSRLAQEPYTLIAFEAPHRLKASLAHLLEALGNRQIVVCRELTKLHEELFYGTLSQAVERFQAPLGEFTLVIVGAPSQLAAVPDEADIRQRLRQLRDQGLSRQEATAQAAQETGLSRRVLYRLWLEAGRS